MGFIATNFIERNNWLTIKKYYKSIKMNVFVYMMNKNQLHKINIPITNSDLITIGNIAINCINSNSRIQSGLYFWRCWLKVVRFVGKNYQLWLENKFYRWQDLVVVSKPYNRAIFSHFGFIKCLNEIISRSGTRRTLSS